MNQPYVLFVLICCRLVVGRSCPGIGLRLLCQFVFQEIVVWVALEADHEPILELDFPEMFKDILDLTTWVLEVGESEVARTKTFNRSFKFKACNLETCLRRLDFQKHLSIHMQKWWHEFEEHQMRTGTRQDRWAKTSQRSTSRHTKWTCALNP